MCINTIVYKNRVDSSHTSNSTNFTKLHQITPLYSPHSHTDTKLSYTHSFLQSTNTVHK